MRFVFTENRSSIFQVGKSTKVFSSIRNNFVDLRLKSRNIWSEIEEESDFSMPQRGNL